MRMIRCNSLGADRFPRWLARRKLAGSRRRMARRRISRSWITWWRISRSRITLWRKTLWGITRSWIISRCIGWGRGACHCGNTRRKVRAVEDTGRLHHRIAAAGTAAADRRTVLGSLHWNHLGRHLRNLSHDLMRNHAGSRLLRHNCSRHLLNNGVGDPNHLVLATIDSHIRVGRNGDLFDILLRLILCLDNIGIGRDGSRYKTGLASWQRSTCRHGNCLGTTARGDWHLAAGAAVAMSSPRRNLSTCQYRGQDSDQQQKT